MGFPRRLRRRAYRARGGVFGARCYDWPPISRRPEIASEKIASRAGFPSLGTYIKKRSFLSHPRYLQPSRQREDGVDKPLGCLHRASMTTQTVTTQPSTAQPSGQRSIQLAGSSEPQVHFSELARGDRNGTLKLRGIPAFEDLSKKRQWAKEHMAAVFRFFGKKGYAEGIAGHISVRGANPTFGEVPNVWLGYHADHHIDPILKDHLWMNPYAKHFSAMKASDLVLVDPEGYVVEGGNQAVVNTAGFIIHSAVHRARPDVHAACHVHSMYGKTWSAFGQPVEMITQGSLLVRVCRPHMNLSPRQMPATFTKDKAYTKTTVELC